jgi:ribosomal protein S18 acetylase RimI-like enzyme
MIIRKATIKDSAFIATHLLLAMEDIVYQFIGGRDFNKAKEFMLYFAARANNQYSYENCWVAEEDQEVVGTVNLYDGARLIELRQPVVDYIKSQFHPSFTPEDETGPGEYYIDTLGVHPKQQGKGIGSKMLQFLVDEYVHKRGQHLQIKD